MKQVWIREGEFIITGEEFKYFDELIKFKEAHIEDWIVWKGGKNNEE